MFMGCGSEENFGTEKMAQQLKELGIKLDVYVSPGTHHEWLTWRRCFKEFVPHLFNGKQTIRHNKSQNCLEERFWDLFIYFLPLNSRTEITSRRIFYYVRT